MNLADRLTVASHASVAELIDRVCRHFGVQRADLMSAARHEHLAQARHVAAWLLHDRGLTYGAIARELKRDGSTVYASVRKVDKLSSANAAVAAVLGKLKGAA